MVVVVIVVPRLARIPACVSTAKVCFLCRVRLLLWHQRRRAPGKKNSFAVMAMTSTHTVGRSVVKSSYIPFYSHPLHIRRRPSECARRFKRQRGWFHHPQRTTIAPSTQRALQLRACNHRMSSLCIVSYKQCVIYNTNNIYSWNKIVWVSLEYRIDPQDGWVISCRGSLSAKQNSSTDVLKTTHERSPRRI